MRKMTGFVVVLILILSTPLLADISGTDRNGKPVILRDNGTWSYVQIGGGGGGATGQATYRGCYIDKPERDIKGYSFGSNQMTNNSCIATCRKKGYKIAATQFSKQCFCGNTFGRYGKAPSGECKYKCSGNQKQNCGGYWRNSVYAVRGGGALGNKPAACGRYAKNAIAQQRVNQSRRCGFAGARWHLSYKNHYNWCMRASASSRGVETIARRDALRRCSPQTGNKPAACGRYAKNAIAQQRANQSRRCGFTGAQWHVSYKNHYNWCMRVNSGTRFANTTARSNALKNCSQRIKAIKLINSVPSTKSSSFKHNTDGRFTMQTSRWDRVPYRMTRVFSGSVRLPPGRRAVLAGNSAGTTGWNIDNFLMIEISRGGRTTRLVAGSHEPVFMAGRKIRKIGRNSQSFSAGEIDLTPYLRGGSVHLRATAFDYGGVGRVSNVYLIMR